MKHFTRHKPSGTRAERSIFGTIFNAMVSVLLVEVALLVASIYVMRVGPQLDQNAEDILAMQVENRSRYIQTILNDAQELSTLESEINALTQELLDSGRIDLATLDSSSITASSRPTKKVNRSKGTRSIAPSRTPSSPGCLPAALSRKTRRHMEAARPARTQPPVRNAVAASGRAGSGTFRDTMCAWRRNLPRGAG